MNRREFLKTTGLVLAGGTLAGAQSAAASHGPELSPNTLGVLVDTTLCIGCRECELACDRRNNLTKPPAPEESFQDKGVFGSYRKYSPQSYTVVNKFDNPETGAPVYVKNQCMHCNHAPCVSACIVGALSKKENGAVHYDYGKCIGCRYCMMACPFQVPANEFDNAFTPSIRKCTFCFEFVEEGGVPACADACPMGVMTFGKREELIEIAHERIMRNPSRYIEHVFGEHDAGGTSWMYLAGLPFDQIGFPKVAGISNAQTSETIMHGMFKHWIPPISLYALVGAAMWLFKPKDGEDHE
jgi:Fe-S-cluster-containing dehydrogenase component